MHYKVGDTVPLVWAEVPLNLISAWILGLLGRGVSWSMRIAVAVLAAAIPLLLLFVLLYFGCGWLGDCP
jgi:hypothetical protein